MLMKVFIFKDLYRKMGQNREITTLFYLVGYDLFRYFQR